MAEGKSGRYVSLRQTLSLVGLALSLAALTDWCSTAGCQATKNGVLMGVVIPVWGTAYFSALFLLLTADRFMGASFAGSAGAVLVALGAGCDAALVLALLTAGVFCLVCLGIAMVMLALCGIEAFRAAKILRTLSSGRISFLASWGILAATAFLCGAAFVGYTYSAALPGFGSEAHAAEPVPSIGKGQTCIRIYSDYFCPGCRKQEKEISALTQAVQQRQKDCKICFIDVPIHGEATQNYSAYFAACYCADPSARNLLGARQVLFGLAEDKIDERMSIEQALKRANLRFNLDYGAIFQYFNEANRLIREDEIVSTPTVIIVRRNGKKVFHGQIKKEEILGAL